MKLDRRSFLQFGGFTLAGAMMGKGARKWILPYEKPYYAVNGFEEWETSVCRQCPAACGIRVRKMDGWPVSIEGNPECPISRGKLCPRGLSGLQAQYNPSRVTSPLHRKNRNDPASWEKTTWDDAIRTISLKLKQIREKRNAHHVIGCMEHKGGLQDQVVRRFFYAFGSNNVVSYSGLRDPGAAATQFFTTGQKITPAYDLKNANFILSVGTPLLEGWLSPTYVHRWFGDFRQGRQHRGRFVQAEDRLSPTAAKADEWVPLRSGSEADFILGLASVLILEDLYDHEFVQQHCAGFENWFDEEGVEQTGFEDLILRNYPLDSLAELTGVSSVTFLRIARDLVLHRPSVIIAEQMDETAGLKTLWASQCLNALLGNIGKQGGLVLPRPDLNFDLGEIPIDAIAQQCLAQVRLDGIKADEQSLTSLSSFTLSKTLLSHSPYPIEAIFYFPGPAIQYFSSREKINAAVSDVPLIVSFSPYLDDKSLDADWILPDCCPLEKWNDVIPESPEGVPVHALAAPVMEAIVDAKDTTETLHLLAKGIGGTVAQAVRWANSEDLSKAGAQQLFEARRGQVYTTEFAGDWLAQMEAGGWWSPQHPDFNSFWQDLIQKGGWWDPYFQYDDWKRTFVLPSGKFDFLSVELRRAVGNLTTFSSHEKPSKSSEQTLDAKIIPIFSLDHVVFLLQPFLLETADELQRRQWDCWAEINPETAQLWNLKNGDRISIQASSGNNSTINIILHPGAMPGQVNIAIGSGIYPKAEWLAGFGVDPFSFLHSVEDPVLHIPIKQRTSIRIEKV